VAYLTVPIVAESLNDGNGIIYAQSLKINPQNAENDGFYGEKKRDSRVGFIATPRGKSALRSRFVGENAPAANAR
jgi:hypothetical protein